MRLKKLNFEEEYALELHRIYGIMSDKISDGEPISMDELEQTFREAALSCGRLALSKFLSEMSENTPLCQTCGDRMRNLGRREKQIVTLLGSCEYSRNYYGCECGEHALPKDEALGVSGTKFTKTVKHVTAQIASPQAGTRRGKGQATGRKCQNTRNKNGLYFHPK